MPDHDDLDWWYDQYWPVEHSRYTYPPQYETDTVSDEVSLLAESDRQAQLIDEVKMDTNVIAPGSAGQPLIVTGDHGHGHHGRHDKEWESSILRESVAGQRETNASFRAADAERSRNGFAMAEAFRDSDRELRRSEKATEDRIAKLENLVLELSNSAKAEAIATRELVAAQALKSEEKRAECAERKLNAYFARNMAPVEPV